MKLTFLRILFILLLAILIITGFVFKSSIQTNILKSILPENHSAQLILNLANKNASKVNIIIEADNQRQLAERVEYFKEKLEEQNIAFQKTNYKEILDLYKQNPIAFLSPSLKEKLLHEKYAEITTETRQKLYDPFYSSMLLVPLNQEPFMILNDYFLNLAQKNDVEFIEKDGKFYALLTYFFPKDIALSPDLLNQEVKKLIELKQSWIYFSGSPIHSYFVSKSAQQETTIISCIALFFVITILWLYFRSFIPILFTIGSIAIAFCVGFLVTSIIFKQILALTFVFSTTLIGICVDYSLHYFVELSKNNKDVTHITSKILKSLSTGLCTTIGAFALLFFSKIALLQQVSVFTASGLISTYLLVVLFYPLYLKKTFNQNELSIFDFHIPKKFAIFCTIASILLISLALSKINFNEDITSLYKPTGELLKSEQLYTQLSNNDNVILLFSSDDKLEWQKHLEAEELLIKKITKYNRNIEYEAFSKYLPSTETQKENIELVSKLYANELDNYANFLTNDTREILKEKLFTNEIVTYKETQNEFLNSFILNKNKTLIILKEPTETGFLKQEKNVEILNIKDTLNKIIKNCTKRCLELILPIFILMFFILAVAFNIKKALLLLLPSLIGSLLALAIPTLLGMQLNFFHIISLFLVIGLGIDYSIFRQASSTWAKDAVTLSAITTIFSFGLLASVSFQLISSLGIVVSIGLLFSYFFSLIFAQRSNNEKVV